MILLYCDESCHLPNDSSDVMVLGTLYCREEDKSDIFNGIRAIKMKHGLSPHFEIKWVKVSPGKIEFYLELIEYFFQNDKLNFRGLVVKGKAKLDHDLFNQGSHDTWYYKMYYHLIKKIILKNNEHKVFIDIKDTCGGERIKKLHEVLCNNIRDFQKEKIQTISQIHSHESEIMQLTDLLIGALSYYHRFGVESKVKNGKLKLVENIIKSISGSLDKSSLLTEKKFNFLIWTPQGGVK